MMSADRLASGALIQNMRNYEALCGGRAVWDNIVIVIPRRDYNEMDMDEEEWKESLKKTEDEV